MPYCVLDASLPIAVVQTIHAGQEREEVIRRLKEYAHNRLAVPFAYLLEKDGTFQEFDWTATEEPIHTTLTALPSRDALWNRLGRGAWSDRQSSA